MLAQHIVDQVGGERDLAARLLLSGKASFDQARNHRAGAEGPLHQRALGKPGIKIVAQHVLVEQRAHIDTGHILQCPDRERILVGHEAQGLQPCPLQPPRQQHAERLVGQPALERVANQVIAVAAREGLHQQPVGRRQSGLQLLQAKPLADRNRQCTPALRIVHQIAHPRGQIGRQGELAAIPAGHFGRIGGRPANQAFADGDAFEAQDLTGEQEGVAGTQLIGEPLLHLAELPAAPGVVRRRGAGRDQPDIEHRAFHDRPDIHPMALGHVAVARPVPAIGSRDHDAAEPVIARQRIAPARNELHDPVERLAVQMGVWRRRRHLAIKRVGQEGIAAGSPHYVLG